MKITNNMNLPSALVAAIKNDNYTKGKSDISVTQLIGPPRIRQLKQRHNNEIVEDASNMIWALVGTIGHLILERAETDDEITENRLYMEVAGWILSGMFDNLHLLSCILTDYKFTSYYAIRDGMKPEWNEQLNVLAELCEQNDHHVKEIQIVAILKDWQRSKAKYDPNYPQVPVVVVKGSLWSREKRIHYIESKVRDHQFAEHCNDQQLQPCTDDERWCVPGKIAVKREGGKRAEKLFTDEDEATAFMADKNEKRKKGSKEFVLEYRPTVYNRCADYCSVSKWCDQYNSSY